MDADNQAFRPLSPDQGALTQAFYTEHLLPFRRRLGDPSEMTTLCDVMVHPVLDVMADTLVSALVGEEEIEDLDAAMAIAQRWAAVVSTTFLSYVRQRAEGEFE
jgi:hypothetical protein